MNNVWIVTLDDNDGNFSNVAFAYLADAMNYAIAELKQLGNRLTEEEIDTGISSLQDYLCYTSDQGDTFRIDEAHLLYSFKSL